MSARLPVTAHKFSFCGGTHDRDRSFGTHPQQLLEGGLVGQHRQPIEGGRTTRLGLAQQGRVARVVHDVAHPQIGA